MKRLTTVFAISAFVIVGIVVIAFARGYRLDFKKKGITGTGMLVATSEPDGAQVFLNDHLTTATNNTLNLPPGEYEVKIVKEGYLSWRKKIKIEAEVVRKTDSFLFPSQPSLKPLTLNGALNPSISPDGSKIAFSVPPKTEGGFDPSLDPSGLWIFPLLSQPLSFNRDAIRIARNRPGLDFSQSRIIWSPDSKQVIAFFPLDPKAGFKADNALAAYLLSTQSENVNPQDITPTLSLTIKAWENQQQIKFQDQLLSLSKEFAEIATVSASMIKFSPDETKVLYIATASATIPPIINPPLIGTNNQPQERELKKDTVYVYDVKEDKNFKVKTLDRGKTDHGLIWLPNTHHLLEIQKDSVSIMEYDGMNNVTVFSGPFVNSFVFPWPDGSKFVILTNLNKSAGEISNLYAISLK